MRRSRSIFPIDVPKTLVLVAVAALLALAPAAVAQTDGSAAPSGEPVEVSLEIFLVNEIPQDDGTVRTTFVPATSARPGQTVEYRVTARNVSNELLPAGIVELFGPVPEGTRFVPNSATPASERLLTEFSADGNQTFSTPPVFRGEGEERVLVTPSDYDGVRWTLLEPMAPGDEETVVYRVVVE